MDGGRLVALNEVRRVAVATKERVELLARDAREDGGAGYLITVEVQDRQHRAVARGVEELVRVPRSCQRTGLRFAVPDNARDEQIGVVEGGTIGVRQGVAELTPLVHGSRRLGRMMAWNPARERELRE